MRSSLLAAAIFFYLLNSAAHAETTQKIDNLLDVATKFLPSEKLRCAANEIRSLVNPAAYGSDESVATQNVGLSKSLTDLAKKNPCFGQTADEFWHEIDTITEKNGLSTQPSYDKPNLLEKAGEGRFDKFEPGWLWNKALKKSGGNPNIALTLLSTCMHDDTAQDFKARITDKQQIAAYLNVKIDKLKAAISEYREELKSVEANSEEYKELVHYLQNLETKKTKYENQVAKGEPTDVTVKCPESASPVFAQKSVDPSMDLPDELKAEIAKVQRPGSDASKLPSKAYHFIGGAATGCALAKCNIDPDSAAKYAGQMANAYRALRLCPQIKELIDHRDKIAEKLEMNPDDPSFKKRAHDELKKASASIHGIPKAELLLKGSVTTKELDDELERQADRMAVELDAATLYSKWYLGGPYSPVPCTALRGGPTDLNTPDYSQERAPHQSRPKNSGSICDIIGWDVERCAKARFKLSSWDVDFNWTRTQHEIGARFGASKCKPQPKDFNLDKALCPSGAGATSPQQKTEVSK